MFMVSLALEKEESHGRESIIGRRSDVGTRNECED